MRKRTQPSRLYRRDDYAEIVAIHHGASRVIKCKHLCRLIMRLTLSFYQQHYSEWFVDALQVITFWCTANGQIRGCNDA